MDTEADKEHHMTTEAETRVMCLQAEERQRLPATAEAGREEAGSSPRALGGSPALPTP